MEKIIEPEAAYTFEQLCAIGGAAVILLALLVIGIWFATRAKEGLAELNDPKNWEWW